MRKVLVLGSLMVLAALLIMGCEPKELRTVKIEMGSVNSPRANPNIERIKENLRQAEKTFPNDPEVYHLWGRVYALEDNYVEMDKAFKKSAELGDKFVAIDDTIRMRKWQDVFQKAVDAYGKQEYDTTLTYLKDAIICWPHQYEPYMYGADAAYRLGKYDEAYSLSKQAYEMVPDTLRVAQQYADLSMNTNHIDAAEPVLKKLVKDDPTNASYLINLAEIYLDRGDTTTALKYSEDALNIDKNDADIWLNVAKLYFLIQSYKEAAESFEHYLALVEAPAKDDYFLYLLSLYQIDEFEKDKGLLEKFTMEYPDYCDAWQLLANCYIKLKMKKESLEANKKFDNCTGK
jgi:tetratricopeptide (TPR) repeat protein